MTILKALLLPSLLSFGLLLMILFFAILRLCLEPIHDFFVILFRLLLLIYPLFYLLTLFYLFGFFVILLVSLSRFLRAFFWSVLRLLLLILRILLLILQILLLVLRILCCLLRILCYLLSFALEIFLFSLYFLLFFRITAFLLLLIFVTFGWLGWLLAIRGLHACLFGHLLLAHLLHITDYYLLELESWSQCLSMRSPFAARSASPSLA